MHRPPQQGPTQKEESRQELNCEMSKRVCVELKIRCVGSALSPNGIAFSNEAMLSLSLLDKVLHIDPESKQVTVQAGARVQEVVEALRPHGLTLQNYASIREQSIGGFTQVGTCPDPHGWPVGPYLRAHHRLL